MMERHYENKFAYFRISNQIVFLEIKDNVVLDINAAASITNDRLHFQRDKIYPVLLNVNGLLLTDKAGRDYLAHYGWFLTRRVSILANHFRSLTIAKFYLTVSKPVVVTQIFNNEKSALQYLETLAY